jgi:formylglycine-generating enzyme required for sulfatase activity
VNGTAKSEIFVGMHQARVYNSRALSLPGLDPTVNVDWDDAHTYCTNKGSGWHLMTNWEWAAVALWMLKQVADGALAHQPRGNTDYGRAHDEYQETGARQDGASYVPGDSSGSARTLTGSGPASWRHDLTAFGISDMVGNVWEWVGGLKIDDGAIKMPDDNYYSMADGSYPDQDATITDANPWSSDGVSPGGTADVALLRAALLDPASVSNSAKGRLYVDTSGERVPLRGGSWTNGSAAGLGALNLTNARSYSYSSLGFRPAFVAP